MFRGVIPALAVLVAVSADAQTVKPTTAPVTAAGKVRDVLASDRTVTEVTMREGFTTMITLPEGETLIRVMGAGGTTADTPPQSLWPANWTPGEGAYYVRPAVEGTETNVHLTSTSGETYSFVLRERKNAQRDDKIILFRDPDEAEPVKVKYVSVDVVNRMEAELADAKLQVEEIRTRAAKALESESAQYPLRLRHYEVPNIAPFHITGMNEDGKFTYVYTTAQELPILYETKDKMPAEVNFKVMDAPAGGKVYIVTKVLGSGFFKMGDKQRLAFAPAATGN